MKKAIFILTVMTLALLLCACKAAPPDEAKMILDLNSREDFMEWVTINEVTILRSQTKEAEKQFIAEIEFKGADDYADYQGSAKLEYNLYDGDIWMLDDCKNLNYEYTCTRAFEAKDIEMLIQEDPYLYLNRTIIRGEKVRGSILDVTVSGEPALEDTMEYVTLSFSTQYNYVIADYLAYAVFQYQNGEWKYLGADSWETEAARIIGLDGSIYSGHYYLSIKTITPSEVVLICEGKEYTFVNTHETIEIEDEYDLLFDYTSESGPMLFPYGVLGYDIEEFNWLTVYLNSQTPSLMLSTGGGWSDHLFFEYLN